MTTVKVTEEVDSALKENNIDPFSLLPDMYEFYDKKLIPKLKEKKIRNHYRYEMIFCFVAHSLTEVRSRKVLQERFPVREDKLLFHGSTPVPVQIPPNPEPLFWVKWVVLKD
jgi:hypothetical protein